MAKLNALRYERHDDDHHQYTHAYVGRKYVTTCVNASIFSFSLFCIFWLCLRLCGEWMANIAKRYALREHMPKMYK